MNIFSTIATELKIELWQVDAAVKLLDEGATVPFIARYRKEVTGTLTDDHLRELEERLTYLRELEDRKKVILASIEEQGKLTDELKKEIVEADNKARLEDLYLPYKPKRRTKAQIAKEAGLEPLADALLGDPTLAPEVEAQKYINEEKGVPSIKEALEGAKQILMERFSEQADLIESLREKVWADANLVSEVIPEKEEAGKKFSDYFQYQEPLHKVPSHRALAALRGQKEEILRLNIQLTEDQEASLTGEVAAFNEIKNLNRASDPWLQQVVDWCWKTKLKIKIQVDLMMRLREDAEKVAIDVFKDNLKNLLMTSPAGSQVVMGLDPGLRTGVKVVVVDGTGKLLNYVTIFPHEPRKDWDGSMHQLAALCEHYQVRLISIGNGTASRETDMLVIEMLKKHPDLKIAKMVVSEAGASVYSASKLAANEFPDLDVSYRGAVSIARRLQDPLAELVKIDPKAIGVGQYQHDVNQVKLGRSLQAVLEDCVNAVGADVNTASVPLLKSISGLNETVAGNIVEFREKNGPFLKRDALKKVPRLGDKTYEQAIGFLRIIVGENPLDRSAVHPEAYPVVEAILAKTGLTITTLMGNTEVISKLKADDFVTEQFGLPTVKDILEELKKPGRDPRPEFKMAQFHDDIHTLEDLKPNMMLEGVVTNVTNFGAFVDIGVHQDGLVHISQLSNQFVNDPHKVVKVGEIVKVKVLEVDLSRRRIQLTMKLQEGAASGAQAPAFAGKKAHQGHGKVPKPKQQPQATAMGAALAAAFGKK